MCDNNSGSKGLYKHNQCKRDNASFADIVELIHCKECGKSILGIYSYSTQRVTAYEKYNYPSLKIEHEHPVDVVTRTDLEHRTAIEFRCIRARLIQKTVDIKQRPTQNLVN